MSNYQYKRGDATRIMKSRAVGVALERAADRGVRAAKKAARARGGTGEFARSIRKEKSTGWDGRPSYRLVADTSGGGSPASAEFGTKRSEAIHALQAGIAEINR